MAIIGKIREQSTLVLIIIGGAIVAFVLSDLFSSGGPGQQGPINLAEVEGVSISPQEFEFKVQEAYETYAANSQTPGPLDERTKSGVREQVYNEMISDVLLGREMDKLGITVSSKELFDMVQGQDPHPNVKQAFTNPETGEFSSAAVVQFLQNLDNDPQTKDQWVNFERALKRNQHINKYNLLIEKAMYLPSPLAKMEAAETNSKMSFNYLMKPYSSVNDSTVVATETEIKSYYDNHLADYEQTSSRKAFYAYFKVRASQMDIDQTREWAEDANRRFLQTDNDSVFVNANSDKSFDPNYYSIDNLPLGADTSLFSKEVGFSKGPYMVEKTFYIQKVRNKKMSPDSVKASHILISTEEVALEVAEAKADSILELLNSGSAMVDLAFENSDDAGSGSNGGDLGWFTDGTMVKPFNDAAFSAKIGEFTMVTSQFGIHIIEVTDRTEDRAKIQLATIERTALPGKDTYADVFNKANSFSIDATDIESFNNLINEGNIQRRVTILSETDNLIEGEPASRDIVRWIKAADENNVSEAYDLDDAFVVAVLEEINEEGPAPLEKVRARVEFEVKRNNKAKQFIEELSGATEFKELANSTGLPVETVNDVTFVSPSIPNVGIEPVVIGKAYSLEKGQTSVPIQGNSGVFVIAIQDKAIVENPDLNIVRSTYNRAAKSRIDNGAVFTAIKENSNIEDNRSKFY